MLASNSKLGLTRSDPHVDPFGDRYGPVFSVLICIPVCSFSKVIRIQNGLDNRGRSLGTPAFSYLQEQSLSVVYGGIALCVQFI